MKNPISKVLLGIEEAFLKRKTKKDILLIASNEIMFGYTRPIYDKLAQDKRIRPWFCLCSSHRFRKHNLSKIRNEYRPRTIPLRIARYLKWDLVLYPVHRSRFRQDCRKIYIGHSLKSGKAVNGKSFKYGRHTRDQDNNIIYDKIFAAGTHEKETMKELYPELYPKVRVVGSLLADELLASVSQKQKVLAALGFDNSRKTVMVASTWGPHSFAQNSGVQFLGSVRKLLSTYNVILSIHQCNFQRNCPPEIDWNKLVRNTNLSNFYIPTNNEESITLLSAADILITDHTSLGLYYLLLERPVIFYENTNVEYEPGALILELKKAAHVVRDIDNIEHDIRRTFDNYDKQKIAEAASKVCSYPNLAWQRYEQEIYETIFLKKYSEIQQQA